ncbi:hypothetical protein ABIB08_005804, partial [Bradyrhizobium sp. RT11b]
FKLRHKPISNQRSIIPRSTPSMEGGTETALTIVHQCNQQNGRRRVEVSDGSV